MQAIVTRFLGPTDTKGSRIKATAEAGSVTLPWDHSVGGHENHARACESLIVKLGWTDKYGVGHRGQWVPGCPPGLRNLVWAFISDDPEYRTDRIVRVSCDLSK